MASISKTVLFVSMLLTILFAFHFKDGESIFFVVPKVTVYVTNNLTNYVQLGVHCKDKNNDIGFQSLHFAESYTFTFRPAYMSYRSLYFCGFSFNNEFHRFDIYVQKRDQTKCEHECHWQIKESGPCKINDGSTECFPWNPNVVEDRQLGHTLNV
ncbi:putative plant self-incompatibility S1 [Medicago truncatula]|uniref:S-protein homolog n=1 Tax=Medicago truncatula TaxID=3880 RepID=G7IEJ9_MEDTR|nr:leguminosin group486 secreted peptide [Medicago truncatula]AES61748.1 leguminosin group486 secreted peptide [Medicago truncatula]RHN81092.1 putative plant self-incompatibility S1 [Medicago truncatula]RHN81097.1 putative plant self-incompatibility S1 [Medicago truncatula]